MYVFMHTQNVTKCVSIEHYLHREVVLRNNNQGKKYASNVARCITLSMLYCSESLKKVQNKNLTFINRLKSMLLLSKKKSGLLA